jgi:uncharacterized membrane protein
MVSNNDNSDEPNNLALAAFIIALLGFFASAGVSVIGGIMGFFAHKKYRSGATSKGQGLSIAAMIIGAMSFAVFLALRGA